MSTDTEPRIDQDPTIFTTQLLEDLVATEEESEVKVLSYELDGPFPYVVLIDEQHVCDVAVGWTAERGFFLDTCPHQDEGGEYVFVDDSGIEPLRARPSSSHPIRPGFVAMEATDRVRRARRDAMTLASGVVEFADALSDRIVDVTEDAPVETVETREGFRLTRVFPIGEIPEKGDPEGFGIVLDDERTDEEFVVSWTPDDGWRADWSPEIGNVAGCSGPHAASFTELDESSTVGKAMEETLARMRRRRENVSSRTS